MTLSYDERIELKELTDRVQELLEKNARVEEKPFPKIMKCKIDDTFVFFAGQGGMSELFSGYGYELNKPDMELKKDWNLRAFEDVEVEAVESQSKPTFPKLMISPNECIVLFEHHNRGYVVSSGYSRNKVGAYIHNIYNIKQYRDFHGKFVEKKK